jgi:hypothetical protein
MTDRPQPPDLQKVKQWSEKMQAICQRWDALIAVTDDMIIELEEQIRQQPDRLYRLNQAKRLLKLDRENSKI